MLLVDMDKQGSLSLSFPAEEGAVPGLLASRLYDAAVSQQGPEYITENLAIIRADFDAAFHRQGRERGDPATWGSVAAVCVPVRSVPD